ncbi:Uu.00g006350.m01.CDS01 [Anthostomella pinea]|uniref:Uu.00g006350.m01.CDS01 n=1 Tax=Anthostomella pinea TaxID=933095 RepID=A0AAI8VLG0_9PEZI|nr:Uu.00g006350.m01.CDS01 [Anthostomella pinea]
MDYYQKFVELEKDKVKDDAGVNNHWVFYSGDAGIIGKDTFVYEFNNGQHREGLKDNDKETMIYARYIYENVIASNDLKKIENDFPSDQKNKADLMDMAMLSFRGAQRAAQRGGIIRFVTSPSMSNADPKKFWTQWEAWILTNGNSKVEKILRYDVTMDKNDDPIFAEPREIWKKGDKALGVKPNYKTWTR